MLLSFALMTPTPPSLHVLFSKNQIAVELSAIVILRKVGAVPFVVGLTPLLNPLKPGVKSDAGMHGWANCDWITS